MPAVCTRSSYYGFMDVTPCGTKDGYRNIWIPAATNFNPAERDRSSETLVYEGTSKIFRTGAAIYIAVVIARSTGRW
jgi:hypothetical protein